MMVITYMDGSESMMNASKNKENWIDERLSLGLRIMMVTADGDEAQWLDNKMREMIGCTEFHSQPLGYLITYRECVAETLLRYAVGPTPRLMPELLDYEDYALRLPEDYALSVSNYSPLKKPLTIDQIVNEVFADNLVSFKLKSLDAVPRKKTNCKAKDGDTNVSQLAAFHELLTLFSGEVAIKVTVHGQGRTSITTDWIRIERGTHVTPEDLAIIEKIAGFCGSGIFAGDLYFTVETDLDISCNAGEPGQDYVKLAVTHGLIEEYYSGTDQCYRRVVEGGEQV